MGGRLPGHAPRRLPSRHAAHWACPQPWARERRACSQQRALARAILPAPTGASPALPPRSLRAGTPTAAISVGARVGPDGALLADSVEVLPSSVAPSRRLSYVDADAIYQHCGEEEEGELFQLLQVGRAAGRGRARGGARARMPVDLPPCSRPVGAHKLDSSPALWCGPSS